MMVLMFKADNNRYGVDVKDVVEVVPCVPLQKLPKFPATLAGLLNYRGSVVPVIDGSRLLVNRAARICLSSRIIMVRLESMRSGCIGLLAEHVTETLKIGDERFTDASMGDGCCSLVDKVVLDEGGMIQHLNSALLALDEFKAFMKPADSGGGAAGDGADGL